MLAFSIDYYGIFFGATQSVELFCTYTRCTGFFCLAIIKGPPNDNYFIIEGPCLDYFTEKVSQTRNVGIFKVKQIRDTIHIASFVKNISAKIS